MGLFDYVADLYSAISITTAEAEERQYAGPSDESGTQSSGKDARSGGIGTAQHDRGATTRGGASTQTPASGTDEESDEEAEINAEDAAKAQSRSGGPEGKTQGGDRNATSNDDEEDEAADEDGGDDEEEDEEEPEDPKPKYEEECLRQSQCAPLKHHYDECAERVQHQIDENGKPEEDCVEEYFHMMHCATQCAAGKLFKTLK